MLCLLLRLMAEDVTDGHTDKQIDAQDYDGALRCFFHPKYIAVAANTGAMVIVLSLLTP